MTYSELYLFPFVMNELQILLAMGGWGFLAWRFIRAYERRGLNGDAPKALSTRVQLLEANVEQVEA
ncbi:MAG: hypothetical protein H0U67_03310, partial [Gemmatimonadetes bacterium]|nr:hypothetical protein [Gemmatimonadota bacterium]